MFIKLFSQAFSLERLKTSWSKKSVIYAFGDLEEVLERIPWKIIWWSMIKLDVLEW